MLEAALIGIDFCQRALSLLYYALMVLFLDE